MRDPGHRAESGLACGIQCQDEVRDPGFNAGYVIAYMGRRPVTVSQDIWKYPPLRDSDTAHGGFRHVILAKIATKTDS